jgi:hypothetical protein
MVLGVMPKQHEAPAAAPEADADRIDMPKPGLMLASAEHAVVPGASTTFRSRKASANATGRSAVAPTATPP